MSCATGVIDKFKGMGVSMIKSVMWHLLGLDNDMYTGFEDQVTGVKYFSPLSLWRLSSAASVSRYA